MTLTITGVNRCRAAATGSATIRCDSISAGNNVGLRSSVGPVTIGASTATTVVCDVNNNGICSSANQDTRNNSMATALAARITATATGYTGSAAANVVTITANATGSGSNGTAVSVVAT